MTYLELPSIPYTDQDQERAYVRSVFELNDKLNSIRITNRQITYDRTGRYKQNDMMSFVDWGQYPLIPLNWDTLQRAMA